MKKKVGFTLAEVLITLGIIGVVAALTAPALVKNSGQAKIGPSLAKFMNTFETGMEQMMEAESLSTIKGDEVLALANHMIMTPINKYSFYDATGVQKKDVLTPEDETEKLQEECSKYIGSGSAMRRDCSLWVSMSERTLWQLKDGSVMIFVPRTSSNQISKGAYKGVVAEILYDIDGDRGVNKAGKDVFSFLVDRTGVLIPSGSNAHSYIKEGTENQYGSEFMNKFVDKSECSTTSDDLTKNLACTGVIADNGWKAEY